MTDRASEIPIIPWIMSLSFNVQPSESGLNTGLVMNERSLSRASGTCWSASPEKMVDT